MRRLLCALMLLWTALFPLAQQHSIDDFFRGFSDGWVRLNPNIAVSTRCFTGEEQDRLEQQITLVLGCRRQGAARVHHTRARRAGEVRSQTPE